MPSKKTSKYRIFFQPKNFSIVIGLGIFSLLVLLTSTLGIKVFDNLDQRMTDVYFFFKNQFTSDRVKEGVFIESGNPQVSKDILILSIDLKSLETFGRWPFPRYVHGDLMNSFSRIKNQNERENALFMDVFFIEPERQPANDLKLRDAIQENGRVFLETVLDPAPSQSAEPSELFRRNDVLLETMGEITKVTGPWEDMIPFLGVQPPMKPFGKVVKGFGHASFLPDTDEVYRRQFLIAKTSELIHEYDIETLQPDLTEYQKNFQRYTYETRDGQIVSLPSPLTKEVIEKAKILLKDNGLAKEIDQDQDGKPDSASFIIKKYQDRFIPSITLSLALNYFHISPKDVEVKLGEYIKLKNPQVFNVEKGQLEPYQVPTENETQNKDHATSDEILIPIDANGQMLINYMGRRSSEVVGEYQTFPVRSYAAYATRAPGPNPDSWNDTLAVGNKILMVGPFAKGIAEDEKQTPFGQMFGVEIHANALNTILMNKFIHPSPTWVNLLILASLTLLTALICSRLPLLVSLGSAIFLVLAYFFIVNYFFEFKSINIPFAGTGISILTTFILVIVYRGLTEEREKHKIKNMFGKYVSSDVVAQMIDNPPELGGVDKDITVLFSDIRGFTTLSESMTPQELVNHLNVYLTAMTDLILLYKGTLDKYVGDEIMCFWGAPLEQKKHALLACKCALRQMEVLAELNSSWPENKQIDIGIGLNSGIMTVGNMGSARQMNYTLMGDNVNLGARLEGTNKEYKTNIIISEATYSHIKETAIVRELDNIRVKGKNRPVVIYELLGFSDGLSVESVLGKSK